MTNAETVLYVLMDRSEGSVIGVFSTPHLALERAFNGKPLGAREHATMLKELNAEGLIEFEVGVFEFTLFSLELNGWY